MKKYSLILLVGLSTIIMCFSNAHNHHKCIHDDINYVLQINELEEEALKNRYRNLGSQPAPIRIVPDYTSTNKKVSNFRH